MSVHYIYILKTYICIGFLYYSISDRRDSTIERRTGTSTPSLHTAAQFTNNLLIRSVSRSSQNYTTNLLRETEADLQTNSKTEADR